MHGDKQFIQSIRREYIKSDLLEESIEKDPVKQFEKWFYEAIESKLVDGNAMTLTTSVNNRPNARIVLLKSFDSNGYVFFTNFGSTKSKEIEENPNACLLFYWGEYERQIRINGVVSRVSDEESIEYFSTRPRESQIGAWASRQSENLPSRKLLETKFQEFSEKYADTEVPRPAFWGGFRLQPEYYEFWQGRPNRLHDRIAYTKENLNWTISRLYP